MIAFHPDNKDTISNNNLPQGMKEIFITTEDGIKLQCYHLPNHNSKQIVIFFHGNAGNISHRIDDLVKFRNIDKIQNIKCPVLVIHGTEDQVVPYEKGVEIYNKLQTKKKMVTVTDAGHNNISSDFSREYWKPIAGFIANGI